MTISYQWLSKYLPVNVLPAKLSEILTSLGLEVESMTEYQSVKGGLKGLLVGEIRTCVKHPEADKLSITTVNIGEAIDLQIVCGANNVAVGQKVVVAPVGCTIYPTNGQPITLKKAKIRGYISEGMICAEDEIGLGDAHDGILVLAQETPVGTALTSIFPSHKDHIYEIGLTPNRMDAMSHLGVARDVCAWMSYHENPASVKSPLPDPHLLTATGCGIEVKLEAGLACQRYSGIIINGIRVNESPQWLRESLKSIGIKPINNIVDITNFILHETGQPLHAFDADKITGKQIRVRMAQAGSLFTTLDGKKRKLDENDLVIADSQSPLCLAGVYGGITSGVEATTTNIFLESAWFYPETIRKTSLRHGLRTDAATRFEKGTDISQTVTVLIRAAKLISEIAGGTLSSGIVDCYPNPQPGKQVTLSYAYLQKLSGKAYAAESVKKILLSLGFSIQISTEESLTVTVPYFKPDVLIAADIVEEIMRVDGLDHIAIPASIRISPSPSKDQRKYVLREKLSNDLVGMGFFEIFTNSIGNSNFYSADELSRSVKMINSLSAELDMLRLDLLPGGLQVIAHNLNRKNHQLRFFEFGKTYSRSEDHHFLEKNNLVIYVSGTANDPDWAHKAKEADFFYLKGLIEKLLTITGLSNYSFQPATDEQLLQAVQIRAQEVVLGKIGEISAALRKQFEVKQPVFYALLDWDKLMTIKTNSVQYQEIIKFPSVNRDLALLVDKNVSYLQVEQIALSGKINQLKSINLFDVFESEKLGAGKKSLAVSFTFQDEHKTLTDGEIDQYMNQLVQQYQTHLKAEIRK